MTISEIKKSAKTKLTGSYVRCAFSSLLYFTIILVLTYIQNLLVNKIPNDIISSLVAAVFAILSTLLGYGILANIIDITDIKTNSITNFLNITIKNTTKYIKLILYVILKILIPIIIFALSGFYLVGTFFANTNKINFLCFNQNLLPLALVILVGSIIFLLYNLLKYILVPYIYHENPGLSAKEIVDKSNTVMKGKKLKYVLLILSFFHWLLITAFIVSILHMFIPYEYLAPIIIIFYCLLKPYMVISQLIFYDETGEEK